MTLTLDPVNAPARLSLQADTAADLMSPDPISVRDNATLGEAIVLLTDKGIGAAPVIDEAGRPIGVLSRTDVLIHDRECVRDAAAVPAFYNWAELNSPLGEPLPEPLPAERVDRTVVRDIMTPVVFSVAPDAPVLRVVKDLLALRVHRLFVIDRAGILVGVVSATDVLRHLAE
jgi:CBS-domain-containing membrane protein